MVNLVLQQKNSGCAVLNGPGDECLTAPLENSCSVFVAKRRFYWSYETLLPWSGHLGQRHTHHVKYLHTICVSEVYLWLYKN